MSVLLCFGLGYCAQHFVAEFGHQLERVIGTARNPEKGLQFDGRTASKALLAAVEDADLLLHSIPPGEAGDPVLAVCSEALRGGRRLASIVYLSSVGVYGDHGGAWVDETTAPRPEPGRTESRRAAEIAWSQFGAETGVPVAILRLAGIYGPGRNALENVRGGRARRIVKPGQIFNRIHVGDIAQAIAAAFARRADGVFNVADDEPAPPQDVIAFAAHLLGVAPPPEISFAEVEATMSPMARSFYGANRRVRNNKLKHELGVSLRYPDYRTGLRGLQAAGPK
jgi:nucleoside-diphosphate-sugar epimerase